MNVIVEHKKFPDAVKRMFSFLLEFGYQEIESSPTISKYRRGNVAANIYYGRSSYEIGFEIEFEGESFTMSELIRAKDQILADRYRNPVATSPDELISGLQMVAELVRQYAGRALRADPTFFELLRHQRKTWSERYALDVLAEQLRPKAETAFRERRYKEAAAIYGQIRSQLTPAELKKLEVATKRSG